MKIFKNRPTIFLGRFFYEMNSSFNYICKYFLKTDIIF